MPAVFPACLREFAVGAESGSPASVPGVAVAACSPCQAVLRAVPRRETSTISVAPSRLSWQDPRLTCGPPHWLPSVAAAAGTYGTLAHAGQTVVAPPGPPLVIAPEHLVSGPALRAARPPRSVCWMRPARRVPLVPPSCVAAERSHCRVSSDSWLQRDAPTHGPADASNAGWRRSDRSLGGWIGTKTRVNNPACE